MEYGIINYKEVTDGYDLSSAMLYIFVDDKEELLRQGFFNTTPKGWRSTKKVVEALCGVIDEDGVLIISKTDADRLLSKYPVPKTYYDVDNSTSVKLNTLTKYMNDPYDRG